MPYQLLYLFFVCFLLFLPWVIQQIKDNRDRSAVSYCCKDLRDKVASLNRLLPDDYKLLAKEHDNISALFQEYQFWLLMCYVEKELKHVLYDYRHYTARRNRKLYHLDKLDCSLFFVETIGYFLDVQVNIHGTWPDIRKQTIYTWRTSDEEILTDIGIVAYKIMLAVHIAHETIGINSEGEIEATKKLLDKSFS